MKRRTPALVLTAGLGTRLDPLTRLIAKPAVPLAGRTLVERVLDWLRAQGVTDVVLNLHHRPETITGAIGDGAHLGMRVRYSWEQPVLGSAGGPRRALPLLDADPFLIVNGDTLSDVALSRMQAAFDAVPTDVLMAVVPNPAPDHYNGIVLDDERRVTGFVPKGPAARGTWHFIGVQIVRASVFAGLPDGVPTETVAGIYRDIVTASPGRIRGWPVETDFLDVGTPADYLDAAIRLAGGDPATLLDPGAAIDATARVERTIVWRGARIGANAHLIDCIVAGDVTIPAGFRAERSLLLPAHYWRTGDAGRVVENLTVHPIDR
jgi:NDP-sugar pyrophosphorylase family protein